jgi:hypothetical protein
LGVLLIGPMTLARMAALYAAMASPDCPPIDRVEIVRHDIFEAGDGGTVSWPYRLANRLHVRTREDVIRRQLLFSADRCADAETLAQTERNLRGTGFLRDARVEAEPASSGRPGAVDVRVSTWEKWTTTPLLGFGQVGNRSVWSVGIAERNLFGRGLHVEVQRRSEIDRDQTLLAFRDPAVAGSRVQASASFADRSDGRRTDLGVARPFFSLDTRWAFAARADAFEQLDPLYSAGERVADLAHEGRALDLEGGRRLGRTADGALRLHGAYRWRRDRVESDQRRFGIAEAGLSFVQHGYLRLTHVNRFERAEDFNLGHQLSAAAGISLPALGGGKETVLFLSAGGRKGLPIGRERFVIGEAAWTGRRTGGRWENGLADTRLAGAFRLAPRALLLTQARYRHGVNLDPETQLTVGAQNGLRGYAVNQWAGSRSLLLGTEARLFVADDVAQLLSFALAAFGEMGYAWQRGTSVNLGDLRSDVGLGVMIGRNRLTSRPLRMDVAYAFNPPPGRSRWQVSAGVQVTFVD